MTWLVADRSLARYSVVLLNTGRTPIDTIKVVREAAQVGLKEARDLVCSSPSTVRSGLTYDDAIDLRARLAASGAVAELRS